VFEAKCVIKICMNDKVVEGAMRLLDNAETIKKAVDLRGSCIALDDCYEVSSAGVQVRQAWTAASLPRC
jgi:hypothetical protein